MTPEIVALLDRLRAEPADAHAHRRLGDAFAAARHWVQAVAEYRTSLALGGAAADLRGRLSAAAALAATPPPEHLGHNVYFRTAWLARHVRTLFPGGACSLLDAGGGDGRLALALPDAEYVLAEPGTNGIFVTESLTFGRSFECTVCCHVLEHIPRERRDAFLDTLCGMSTRYLLLLNPVVDAHVDLAQWQQAIFDITGAAWAKEHIDCDMPRLDDITSFAERRGYRYRVAPNGSKPLALAMVFLDYYARSGTRADVQRIHQLFNRIALDDLDHAAWPNAYLVEIATGAD